MQITLRVYATLCRYVPGVIAGIPVDIDLPEGATVGDLIKRMGLPEREVKIAFVNGRRQSPDWLLNPGDEVGVFPPIGGG